MASDSISKEQISAGVDAVCDVESNAGVVTRVDSSNDAGSDVEFSVGVNANSNAESSTGNYAVALPGIVRLPTELVLNICENLPIYDIVRWGMTGWHFQHKVELTQVWTHIRRQVPFSKNYPYDEERWQFLQQIEPTLPDYELCYTCKVVHPRGPVEHQSLRRVPDPETPCDAKQVQFLDWGIDWGFGFKDVYAIMKRHRFGGSHGLPLSDLSISTNWKLAHSYTNLLNAARANFKRFVSWTKLDAEAVVVNNQLMVHRTQRLCVPIHLQGTDVLLRYGIGDIASGFKICSHHGPSSGEMINNFITPFRNSLQIILATGEDISHIIRQCSKCSAKRLIRRCEDCPTEYETTFYVHDNKSLEFVLDVWQNFGECRDLMDPGWLNCWGGLEAPLQEPPDAQGQWRKQWMESDVGYVLNKETFTQAGQSAANDSSATAVHEDFYLLHNPPETVYNAYGSPRKRVKTPTITKLSDSQLAKLRDDVARSCFPPTERRTLPQFPFHPDITEGAEAIHVNFTRMGGTEKSCPARQLSYTKGPLE